MRYFSGLGQSDGNGSDGIWAGSGGEQSEGDDLGDEYTLPVEVFNRNVPVLVSRPEPVNMAIPDQLDEQPYYTEEPAGADLKAYLPYILLAVGGLALLGGRKARR